MHCTCLWVLVRVHHKLHLLGLLYLWPPWNLCLRVLVTVCKCACIRVRISACVCGWEGVRKCPHKEPIHWPHSQASLLVISVPDPTPAQIAYDLKQYTWWMKEAKNEIKLLREKTVAYSRSGCYCCTALCYLWPDFQSFSASTYPFLLPHDTETSLHWNWLRSETKTHSYIVARFVLSMVVVVWRYSWIQLRLTFVDSWLTG